MVEVVADHGLAGASMSLVAELAGVATGTAYVHYESKEDLLIAAFVEVKTNLGLAALMDVDRSGTADRMFQQIWRNCYRHLSADPAIARFLLQVEASPIRQVAHEALDEGDLLTLTARDLSDELVDLPTEVLYDLALAPAVRLVASSTRLREPELDTLIEACWRAVART